VYRDRRRRTGTKRANKGEKMVDTSNYMILGYAIAFIVMGGYVFSLYLRNANFKRDIETLEALDKEQKKK
jgi:amino acid permease